jgi:hypothetical protein
MGDVGVLARFEFGPDNEDAVERFFRDGREIVDASQPETTVWFAFRIGPTTYGAFASFASEADREALLTAGGPRSVRENVHLFQQPPTFELVDVVAARRR